ECRYCWSNRMSAPRWKSPIVRTFSTMGRWFTRATPPNSGATRNASGRSRARARKSGTSRRSGREQAPLAQRLREGAGIDVFELAAHRHAAREPRHAQVARCEKFAEVMRRRLALIREVGREDHFAHDAVSRTLQQLLEPDFPGSDAVERREPAHQHEIESGVGLRLLDHQQIGGRLDDA